jgi:glucose-1-phosphate cytidylyltransferase
METSNLIRNIQYVRDTDILINGGFFVFRRAIFDYIQPGDELVEAPFQRLMAEQQLIGYKYLNYWCMDTFKDQQELSDMCMEGTAPWEVWRHSMTTVG